MRDSTGYPSIDAITDGTISGWDRARRAKMRLACWQHLQDLRMAGHDPRKTELQIPPGAINHIPARAERGSSKRPRTSRRPIRSHFELSGGFGSGVAVLPVGRAVDLRERWVMAFSEIASGKIERTRDPIRPSNSRNGLALRARRYGLEAAPAGSRNC